MKITEQDVDNTDELTPTQEDEPVSSNNDQQIDALISANSSSYDQHTDDPASVTLSDNDPHIYDSDSASEPDLLSPSSTEDHTYDPSSEPELDSPDLAEHKTSPFESKPRVSKEIDNTPLLRLDLGNNYIKPRGNFVLNGRSNFSIHYEEESKKMNMRKGKGYTSINLIYELRSKKASESKTNHFESYTLFDCYDDYVINQQKIGSKIQNFHDWADDHFAQEKPPIHWHGSVDQWQRIQNVYRRADLISLTPEELTHYETKFIDGNLYVKASHPHKIYNPDYVDKKNDDDQWVLADSHFGNKTSQRIDTLIYVFAEKEVLVNGRKTFERIMYIAKDSPGKFHHSTITTEKVLCAGTLKINNGIITEITAESGHFRPTEQRFKDLKSFLHWNNVKHDTGHWHHKNTGGEYSWTEHIHKKTGKTYKKYTQNKKVEYTRSSPRFFDKSNSNKLDQIIEADQTEKLRGIFASERIKSKPDSLWGKSIKNIASKAGEASTSKTTEKTEIPDSKLKSI